MFRSTTPTVRLNIKNQDFDMSLIRVCHVTLESENKINKLIVENPIIDSENRRIQFRLTQEQTLKFNVGNIKIQAKMKLTNGSVISSQIVRTSMNEILEEELL